MERGEFTFMNVQGIQADVERFMREFDQDIPISPTIPDADTIALRYDLILEEWREVEDALMDIQWISTKPVKSVTGPLADLADGIADLIYVAVGTASACGIDLDPVWEAVQKANMAKAGGPVAPNGKKLKPEGWEPPDIEKIIKEQMEAG